jgi:uncharacterized peroxidase-related enzyme
MFTYYAADNAPAESLPLIEQSKRDYGFLPNLHSILAAAPAAYAAYLETFRIFAQDTTLSPLEQQVVMMTANVENHCHYCVPGHSMLMTMAKMPADVIEALREDLAIADPKLRALQTYAKRLIAQRGHLSDAEIDAFLAAGYDRRQALDVLVGLSTKLISNFANALAGTEIDAPVKRFAWTHPSERKAA